MGVRAEESTSIVVTSPTDFFVEFSSDTDFLAETFMSPEFPSDPHLWLYDATTGELLAANDDWNGLQSHISLRLPAGLYRLRAAVCCGNPDGWYVGGGWNQQYELRFTGQPVLPDATTTTTVEPSTSTTLTTTLPEETTTTVAEVTTTTENVPSTSVFVETTTTTVVEPSTSVDLPTTTTTEVSWTTTTINATTTTVPAVAPPPRTTVVPSSSLPVTSTSTIAPGSSTSIDSTESLVPDATDVPTTDPVDAGDDPAGEDDVPLEQVNFAEQSAADIAEELAPESLELLSDDAVEQLVESIADADLTEEQADAIAVALSDAPDNVKEEFEDQVNVFGGQFDLYVPLGSVINVGQRRVVVAATATVLVMPVPTSTGSGSPSKKGKK